MGVTGLWTLTGPVGRPIAIETLAEKPLAIDASIWMYQFQMTMRDKASGTSLDGAHIMGTFRRIMKLLFHGIKPVFVFDGEAPMLKKRTISQRKQRKEGATKDHAKTAQKLLSAQLRAAAVDQSLKGVILNEDTVYLDDDPERMRLQALGRADNTPSAAGVVSPKKKKYVPKDQYALPNLNEPLEARINENDTRLATESELRDFIDDLRVEDFDMDSPFFADLPVKARYEILNDLWAKSRQVNHKRVDAMRAAPTPLDFSRAQIANVMERNNVTQKLLELIDDMGHPSIVVTSRIVGEKNKEYVLIKQDISKGGGWVLGVRNSTATRANKIETVTLDDNEAVFISESDSEESDDDDLFEEVDVAAVTPRGSPAKAKSNPSPVRHQQAIEAIKAHYFDTPVNIQQGKKAFKRSRYGERTEPKTAQPGKINKGKGKATEAPLFLLSDSDNDFDVSEPGSREYTKGSLSTSEAPVTMERDAYGSNGSNDYQPNTIPEQVAQILDDGEADTDIQRALFETYADSKTRNTSLKLDSDSKSYAATSSNQASTSKSSPSAAVIEHSDADDDLFYRIDIDNAKHTNDGREVREDSASQTLKNPSHISVPLRPSLTESAEDAVDLANVEDVAALDDTVQTHANASTTSDHLSAHDITNNRTDASPESFSKEGPSSVTTEPVIATKGDFGSKDGLDMHVDYLFQEDGKDDHTQQDVEGNEHNAEQDDLLFSPKERETNLVPVPKATPPLSQERSLNIQIKQEPLDEEEKSTTKTIWDDQVVEEPQLSSEAVRTKPSVTKSAPETSTKATQSTENSPRQRNSLFASDIPNLEPGALEKTDEVPQNNTRSVKEEESEEEVFYDWETTPEREIGEIELSSDEEAEKNIAEETNQYAEMVSKLRNKDIETARNEAHSEVARLKAQRNAEQRNADSITLQMGEDIKEMLRLFGIPYVEAPQEAEAECANLFLRNLVDGIATDDSDVFLFGGDRVYRNLFRDDKYVECYLMSDLERELGLGRERLIQLAYILGSDYDEGMPGVGPVLGRELIEEFDVDRQESSDTAILRRFNDWWQKVQKGEDNEHDTGTLWKVKFKRGHKDLILEGGWPDPTIARAYREPVVTDSNEPFSWSLPDLDGLRTFLKEHLSWNTLKTDELLLPLIKRQNQVRKNNLLQSNLRQFFDVSVGHGPIAPVRKVQYQSTRLQKVVERWRARLRKREAIMNGEEVAEEEKIEQSVVRAPKKRRAVKAAPKSRKKKKKVVSESSDSPSDDDSDFVD